MNLLVDKREQELPAEDKQMQDAFMAGLNAEEEPFEVDKKSISTHSKSKSPLGVILVAVLVFIAAFVVVYFGYYKNKVQAPGSTTEIAREGGSQTADAADVASADETATVDEGAAVAANQTSCIIVASDVMKEIAGVLANGARIEAMFFDEGSFSAEISAPSGSEAVNIYNTIKNNLGSEITLTSSQPLSGRNALIAGTFNSTPNRTGSEISNIDLEMKLRDIADEVGAVVSSLNISNAAQGQTVFLKLSGTFDACQQFLQRLSQQNLSITVSKLLLMPGQNGNYAFILRFYL